MIKCPLTRAGKVPRERVNLPSRASRNACPKGKCVVSFSRSAFVGLAVCLSALPASGQAPGGTLITGPSPWIDVTAPPYSAACNGSTDDTAAIQTALNAIGPPGAAYNTQSVGMALFIPATGKGCYVKATHLESVTQRVARAGRTAPRPPPTLA